MCAPSFLVCARLTTCVHTHSLEGTLLLSEGLVNVTRDHTGLELRSASTTAKMLPLLTPNDLSLEHPLSQDLISYILFSPKDSSSGVGSASE